MENELSKEVIMEGLLYLVGEDGIKKGQLAEVLSISTEETEVYLNNIQKRYEGDGFALELVNYGGLYKFVTKKAVYDYASRLFATAKASSLSQSALETLAIIAYKQPITRSEIEELRGVSSDMMIRKLQARNLIRDVGRSEAPGRPILYEVTEEFMDSFKLESLADLPEVNEYQEESEELFEE